MPLRIYNTLSRTTEDFVPLTPGTVGMYVCGPTVYGHSHVGHAKSYVSFDVIVRYLRHLGLRVLYVQNITDVGHLTDDADEGEDKIERQSRVEKVHPMQIAETFTRSYFEDMDAMNVLRPDISPRATGHIVEQIGLVQELIGKGFAYEAEGSVYFDVSKDAGYGKLSNRDAGEAESGTRVAVKSGKRNPSDFALWKKADPGHIMQWPSPWGMGFPGWHVECSAMSMKYLGGSFDIHGGGMDNLFPHHECEIAQSEAVTGRPFVKYWVHNNLVTVGGQKMGKSLGNVILLKDAFEKFPPLVMRFFILQSHYRGTLDFTEEAMTGAARGYEKLINTVRNLRTARGGTVRGANTARGGAANEWREAFSAAMDDDFNTAQAIAVLFDAAREINPVLSSASPDAGTISDYDDFFSAAAGDVLGLLPGGGAPAPGPSVENELMELLIRLRAAVRKEKLFALSDSIRDGLQKIGITLEDKKGGTSWKKG